MCCECVVKCRKWQKCRFRQRFRVKNRSVWQNSAEAIELYLKAENTQEKIAELLGIPRITILDKINGFKKNVENAKNGDFDKDTDFTPILYNIWNLQKANIPHISAKSEEYRSGL